MRAVHIDELEEPSGTESPLETVRDHRELFERLADTDLPIAPYAQNALDKLEEGNRDI
ncbi:hypothetical protein [Halorubrum sp. HHNYT27]|uniref:hypothetical protein n=1 Tax=Halorubrum sp. HHNYT27 TaxID=3402275 RepID=UPI003EB89D52